MYSLKVLDASNNALQGTVPNLFSSSLQQLYLDHNQLTGGVPSMYGSSQQLRCWSLDHNPGLCGSLPAGARCLDLTGTNIGELVSDQCVCVCAGDVTCAHTSATHVQSSTSHRACATKIGSVGTSAADHNKTMCPVVCRTKLFRQLHAASKLLQCSVNAVPLQQHGALWLTTRKQRNLQPPTRLLQPQHVTWIVTHAWRALLPTWWSTRATLRPRESP
jgi:hypothetical protein